MDWKTAVRMAFTSLIKTEDDLFTFCKYASLICKLHQRKCFSRTVRKAISAWYELQTPDTLRTMWMAHRGLCGFTHKVLIKLCHVTDIELGSADVAKPFFKTCSDLIKETETAPDPKTNNKQTPNQAKQPATNVAAPTVVVKQEREVKTETTKTPPTHEELILGISKLRTTKKNHDALKIIRKYKLPYTQVPGHLLNYAPILTQLLPTMSHFQIFKCWRRMARNRHLDNHKIFKICKSRLENQKLAKQLRLQPIHFLMSMRDNGIVNEAKKMPPKKVASFKMDYLNNLYLDTFQWNAPGDNLSMHITLNLQSNYKKSKFEYKPPNQNYLII